MTYNGAIKQLYEMRDNIWMPEFFKPYFDKIIETLTDDVRENVKGKWILHIDDLFPEESTMECNQCHEHQPVTIDDNFCPNCGAQMIRGES